MEERFDRLEGKIDALITTVDRRFTEVETRLGARIDGVEEKLAARIDGVKQRLDARIDGVEEKLGGLAGELRAVENRLRGHIEDVDAHLSTQLVATGHALTAHVTEKFDALNLKINVLHDDLKDDFRFSLEAQQGLKEQMETGFKNQERALKDALAPLEAAIRRRSDANERAI